MAGVIPASSGSTQRYHKATDQIHLGIWVVSVLLVTPSLLLFGFDFAQCVVTNRVFLRRGEALAFDRTNMKDLGAVQR